MYLQFPVCIILKRDILHADPALTRLIIRRSSQFHCKFMHSISSEDGMSVTIDEGGKSTTTLTRGYGRPVIDRGQIPYLTFPSMTSTSGGRIPTPFSSPTYDILPVFVSIAMHRVQSGDERIY